MISKHSLYPMRRSPQLSSPSYSCWISDFLFPFPETNRMCSCSAICIRFFWSFKISSGEQLSISMMVLLDNFLCFVSFRFLFSSMTLRTLRFFSMTSFTFSIPSITNIWAWGMSYLTPYSFSSIRALYF